MTAPHTVMRLIADDLTGALDSAAQFTTVLGPVPVVFREDAPAPAGSFAFDSGTRDQPDDYARAKSKTLGGFFEGADIAFRKIDTLMRGHPFAEIAVGYRLGQFRSCVVAPAYPAQGRVTRDGRQWIAAGETSAPQDLCGSIVSRFASVGISARSIAVTEQMTGEGVFVCDAQTQSDLDAVVADGLRLPGPVLWCGSAGLAAALGGGANEISLPLTTPLTLFAGSPHECTRQQLEHLSKRLPGSVHFVTAGHAPPPTSTPINGIGFRLNGLSAEDAQEAIARTMRDRLDPLHPPASLLAIGGETLRAIATHVGADYLCVSGEAAPGVPVSTIVGGNWDGVTVASKSGAFGTHDILVRLINRAVSSRPLPA